MPTPQTETDFKSLTITLGGRPYPLRVLPEDEEPIRRIAKELNDKLTELQESYPGKDKQDCLAMLLLIYSVDLFKVKESGPSLDPSLMQSLSTLEKSLSQTLKAN